MILFLLTMCVSFLILILCHIWQRMVHTYIKTTFDSLELSVKMISFASQPRLYGLKLQNPALLIELFAFG